MTWLATKLSDAKKNKRTVSLAMHIPPGIDVYNVVNENSSSPSPRVMWQQSYRKTFIDLMKQYKGTVVTSFAGHTHMDDFRIIADNTDNSVDSSGWDAGCVSNTPAQPVTLSSPANPFMVIRTTPAISPLFGNNPAFSTYTQTGLPGDIGLVKTYYIANLNDANPSWKDRYLYDYANYRYYSAGNLYALAQDLQTNGAKAVDFGIYQQVYNATAPSVSDDSFAPRIDASSVPDYTCAQTSFTEAAYTTCTAAAKK